MNNKQDCTPLSGSSITVTFEYLNVSALSNVFRNCFQPFTQRPPRSLCQWCNGTGVAVIFEGHDGFSRPCQECEP